jgi:uncharacterized membrane protein
MPSKYAKTATFTRGLNPGLIAFSTVLSSVCLALQGCHPEPPKPLPKDPKQAFYVQKVEPILSENCYRCHAGMSHKGNFSMSTRTSLLAGGKDGIVVIPGNAAESRLVRQIHRDPTAGKPMPQDAPLTPHEIDVIEKWINDGAAMPEPMR